jgi:peroxin-1
VDTALLRPGRLDVHVLCDIPTRAERVDIITILSKKLHLDEEAQRALPLIAACDECNHFTGSDLSAILNTAQLDAIEDALAAPVEKTDVSEKQHVTIGLKHLQVAVRDAHPSLIARDRKFFHDIQESFQGRGSSAAGGDVGARLTLM